MAERDALAAGIELRALLDEEPFRSEWRRHQVRESSRPGPNESAVAKVIALFLWDSGRCSDQDTDLPRKLKDRVNRALRGQTLSDETLEWFVEAFGLSPEQESRLRSAGRSHHEAAPISGTLGPGQFVPLPQHHRTVSVFERRILGPDGAAVAHRTKRAIRADRGPVECYPYRLVRGAREVTVLDGGYLGPRHEFPGSSPVVEITLNERLEVGQVGSLEYEVHFAPGRPPATEYRRVAHGRTENVDIVVQFAAERRPSGLWWTVWDDHRRGAVLEEEPVTLDREGRAHRFVPYLERAAAGFRWTW